MNGELRVVSKKTFRAWLGTIWPRLAAAIAILLLPVIGCICAWKAPHPFAFQNRLFALAVTLGPAVIYAFGYFGSFPDVLGTDTRMHRDSLLRRWSNLARISSGAAIIITCVCWASIATKHFGIVIPLGQTPSFINFFVLGMLSGSPDLCIIGAILAAALMTISVVASEQFLARWTDPMSARTGVS